MQVSSQAPPIPGGSFQVLPAGFDCGNGSVKLALENSETRIPSYVRPVFGELDSSSEYYRDGLVEYLSGDRADLVGAKWFAGEHAYITAPGMQASVVDDRRGKLTYALQLLLGAIAGLAHRPHWQLLVAASTQDAEATRSEFGQQLKGVHTVRMNAKATSIVSITVLGVAEEGVGAIASTGNSGTQAIALDIGHGTVISSLFARGKLISRDVQLAGVEKLITSIAKHANTRKHLCSEGDKTVIRKAIENGTFDYGTTGWNFGELYRSELVAWSKAVLAPALKAIDPWRATSESAIAIGGGAQMPGLSTVLAAKGFQVAYDPTWANARGLLRLAQAKRRGN